MAKVLVLDDEQSIVVYVKQALSASGHEVLATSDATEAMDLLKQNPIDIAILDLRMPEKSGLDFFADIQAVKPVPVLFVTAFASDRTFKEGPEVEHVKEAFASGMADILYKPFTIQAILGKVNALLAKAGRH
ncbi:MAG: response regulator transcription factor [Kiritimatiellae bacterium]|nr:response regulator transcription factor [Kiritimatiellia bacterium]